MSAWAKPGVKCVCIDPVIPVFFAGEEVPDLVKGAIYTIRDIERSYGTKWLSFIERPFDDQYEVKHFRPLINQVDDVALFTHHFDREGADA